MKKIIISGASGDLGQQITALLLEKLPVTELTLVTRTPEKLAARTAQGVAVCYGDYAEPDSLDKAYAGHETLMLISSLDAGKRVPEHRNAINAAKRQGIKNIVYTSYIGLHPKSPTISTGDHIATERDLYDSGLNVTILRNAAYADAIPTFVLPGAFATGIWSAAAGDGRIAPVAKADVARCAATCLLDPHYHGGATYSLTGPELLNFKEMAALVTEVYGQTITYKSVTPEERLGQYDAMNVPRHFDHDMPIHPEALLWSSDELISSEVGIAQHFQAILTYHVELITGHKATPLRAILEADKENNRRQSA